MIHTTTANIHLTHYLYTVKYALALLTLLTNYTMLLLALIIFMSSFYIYIYMQECGVPSNWRLRIICIIIIYVLIIRFLLRWIGRFDNISWGTFLNLVTTFPIFIYLSTQTNSCRTYAATNSKNWVIRKAIANLFKWI